MTVTLEFTTSIFSNLTYWYNQVLDLDERQFITLETDWPNILRAVRFGLHISESWLVTAQLALELFTFVERRGYWNEWIFVLEELKEKAGLPYHKQYGLLLGQLGNFHRLNRKLPEAIHLHLQAETIMRKQDDFYELARVYHDLSEDYRLSRQYENAERYGLAAWDTFERLGLVTDAGKGGVVLNTLGLIAHAQGDYTTAKERISKAVELFRHATIPTELGRTLKNLGNILLSQGDREAAILYLIEASQILAETTNDLEKVMVKLSLGTVYFDMGELDKAETIFRSVDVVYLQQSGHTYYQALLANNLGNLLLKQNLFSEAEYYLQISANLWRYTEDKVMLANTLGTLGETLTHQSLTISAKKAYEEALMLLAQYPEDAWAVHLQEVFLAQLEDQSFSS